MSDFGGGTQLEFTYAPGVSTEQIIGFEMAGEIWSSYLTDDVTLRIHVESTNELPDEVIGAALPGKKKKEKYDKIYDALANDITSSNDQTAFANLPSDDKEFSVLVNGQELDETKEFRVNNANAKALGLLKDDRDKLDGYIVVNDLSGNSTVGWDYDALRSDGIGGNEIDFLSVAMHEVGHVLGFVSGIDDSDWLKVLTKSQEEKKEIKGKDFKFASPLDLYRYSDSSADSGNIDLSLGGNPFFSIDGGNTKLGSFANGQYTDFGGDGYQASHWEQFSSQGIMDPVLPVGLRKDISNLDLTSMDVIGWNLNTSAAPSWDEMHANAVADAEIATVEDREKDVEKMVKESNYDARRARGSRSRVYSWQIGLWQYTTLDSVDVADVSSVEEFIDPVDVDKVDNNLTDNQSELIESESLDNENTSDTETEADNQTELVDTPSSEDNLDSDLVSVDDPQTIDDSNTDNLENVFSEDLPEASESSDNDNSSDSDNISENETDSTTEEEDVQEEASEDELITANSSENFDENDESEDDDNVENYWKSYQGYWYLQDSQPLTTGVAYYDVEQDSLIG